MDWKQLTLADICRLVEAIDQVGGNPEAVQSIIDRAPVRAMEHGRVTVESLLKLLAQTAGSTVLPEALAAQLVVPTAQLALPHVQPNQLATSQRRAHQIMRQSFFGVERAMECFGIDPTAAQLAALVQVPFSESLLRDCQSTHILVAVFPLSICAMREHTKTKPRPAGWEGIFRFDNLWYNYKDFANDPGEIGWHLIRIATVQNSHEETWAAQQALLDPDDVVPTARVWVYTSIAYLLTMKVPLFFRQNVRTATVVDDTRVVLGFIGEKKGLFIGAVLDDLAVDGIGLAAAKKPLV